MISCLLTEEGVSSQYRRADTSCPQDLAGHDSLLDGKVDCEDAQDDDARVKGPEGEESREHSV